MSPQYKDVPGEMMPTKGTAPHPVSDAERAKLEKAKRYLDKNWKAQPTLLVVAQSIDLSLFHFHRRFTFCFGITPKRYMTGLQIAAARELILHGTPLGQIPQAVGFSHQSHFTSRFKQMVGMTPGQWQKAQAKDLAS
jgi:AraC family transcriptional regulator